jgi:hypothetical protein
MVLLYSFLVDGVEIADPNNNNYVLTGTKVEHTKGDSMGNFASIKVDSSIDNTINLTTGMSVVISRGETTAYDKYVFRGQIKKITISDDTYILTCADKLQELKYKLFTKSYDRNADSEAGEVSAIFKDIAEDGGFTVSTEDSGTTTTDVTLDKFRNKNKKRLDRLEILSSLIDWVFYYDYDNEFIRHEPSGYTEFIAPIIVGENIYNIPKWEENIENMRNVITVAGATQLDTRIESFTASADTDFILAYTPISIEVKVDSVLKKLGIEGATTTYDYTLDTDLKTITFLSAQTGAVVINYVASVPSPVSGKNIDSINEYQVEQEEIFTFDDITTISDAEARLQQLLTVVGTSDKSTSIFTDEFLIKVGDKITYQNPQNSIKDGSYVVSSKVINYGESYDTIKIGTPSVDINKIFMSYDERLKQLEGSDTEFEGILRSLFNLLRTFSYGKRYFKKQKRDRSNDILYDTGRFYDNGELYDQGAENEFEDFTVIQGNNTYKELFYDDDFYDASNSNNVTWNTSTNKITFLANGYVQTSALFKDGTETKLITQMSFSFTNTGTLSYYASADGGTNWELLSTSPHSFTDRGYELLFKAVETAGSTAEISDIEVK